MKAETKIYSDFIKRLGVVVKVDHFIFNGDRIQLNRTIHNKWYADQDDNCYTKKAAIYYWIKNHTN